MCHRQSVSGAVTDALHHSLVGCEVQITRCFWWVLECEMMLREERSDALILTFSLIDSVSLTPYVKLIKSSHLHQVIRGLNNNL